MVIKYLLVVVIISDYMAEVCLQVILALDSNTGPRANVAIQWHYNLVAGVNHAHGTLEVARWETLVYPGVGVFCLMCVVILSRWLCQLMWARRGMCLACRVFPVTYFFPNIWGLATLTKLKTEMRICRTKFGTVMLEVHHLRGMNGIPFLTEH